MRNVLRNTKGGGYIIPCVITVVLALILSAVLFYARCMTIVQTTRTDTERVLESFIMKNSIDIYNSIKQGHDFTEEIDENFYISQTSAELSLDSSKKCLYNYDADGEIVYYMTNPNVTYEVDNALKLKASYTVTSPVNFAGNHIFDLEVPLYVTRSLTLKE